MAENDAIANKNLLPSSNLRSNQRELFFIRNCCIFSQKSLVAMGMTGMFNAGEL